MFQVLIVVRHRHSRDSLTSQVIPFNSRSDAEDGFEKLQFTYSHHSTLEAVITRLY